METTDTKDQTPTACLVAATNQARLDAATAATSTEVQLAAIGAAHKEETTSLRYQILQLAISHANADYTAACSTNTMHYHAELTKGSGVPPRPALPVPVSTEELVRRAELMAAFVFDDAQEKVPADQLIALRSAALGVSTL